MKEINDKKQLEIEMANKEKRENEKKMMQELRLSEGKEPIPVESDEIIAQEKPLKVTMQPSPLTKKIDWEQIVEAYYTQFNKKPNTNGGLVFSSDKEAIAFFTEQAKQGLEFLSRKYVNGQPTEFHVFSCGDSQLYSGDLATIKKDLQSAIDKNPVNTKTQEGLKKIETFMMRNQINEVRENNEPLSNQKEEESAPKKSSF